MNINKKTVCSPIATLILMGSLIGGANASIYSGDLSMQVTDIDVLEATNPTPDTYNFSSSSLSLLDLTIDFTGFTENYSVYWSDADGSLNSTGAFLSISGSTGVDNGFNISEVFFNNNTLASTHTSFIASSVGDDVIMGGPSSGLAINGITSDYTRFKTGDARITIGFQSIPEPSSVLLLGLGSLSIVSRRHRR